MRSPLGLQICVKTEAIFLVKLETRWERARSKLEMSFLMIVPYISWPAMKVFIPIKTKNTATDLYSLLLLCKYLVLA